MKILELTTFSAGICGVWQRVKQEAVLLSEKGYQVQVFSSNSVKGTNKIASAEELIGKVKVKRFPFKKLGGESYMKWDFEREAIAFKPDIIIAHSYRHTHTTKALKIAKILRKQKQDCKVFLVTHAPFDRQRGFIQNAIISLYDILIGKTSLKKFDKVIAITQWEIPHLKSLGVEDYKIIYIPNGIPKEFFTFKKQVKKQDKILFLGRISPIKDLETLIKSISLIKNKTVRLEMVGPAEQEYKEKLDNLIKQLPINISNRITFSQPIYNLKEKIEKLDSCGVFILPSKSEGMPQSLIEAMAREKVVISSNTPAALDLIEDSKNGFIFQIGNEKELTEKINEILDNKNKNIKRLEKQAKNSVKKFSWDRVIDKLIYLF